MGRVRRADRPKTSQPMPPARAHTVAVSRTHAACDGPEDEEDICPVCEGECTCNNVVESVTASSFAEFNRQQQAKSNNLNSSSHTSTNSDPSTSNTTSATTSSNPTKFPSALPAGFRPSSSKGLPRPSSYATAAASPSPTRSNVAPRLQLKLRLAAPAKNPDETLSDSSSSTIDAPHHPSGPHLARFPLPKRAPSPSSGTATPRNALDDRIPPAHTPKMVPPKVIAKAKGKGKAPVERKTAPVTKKSAQGNTKKPVLPTTKKRKLGRPHKKRVRETTSESSLSDFDDFDEDDFLPYHGSGQTQQPKAVKRKQSVDPDNGFATFVSASVFEGSGSGSDSETCDLGLSGDSEIEAEEERLIVAEEAEERRQRKLRELLMGSNRQNHTGGGGGGQQWQIKPRRKSVEGEQSDDDKTSSESGGEDEEEGEDEDDPDEDEPDGDEPAAAWSTDDSEDLFFANLSDSSMSFSGDQDDEDDDDSETVSSTADLAEAANAGFLSGMGMPMVVMEDFGASLGLGMGLGNVLDVTDLDLEFEQRARAQLAEEKRSPEPASADVFSAAYDYTKEAMDAINGLEMDIVEEDTDATEYEDSDMDGDTTADEMERGRTPSRFRFPTPPAINPLATFTPSPATSPVGWRDFTPTHFRPTPLARGNPHTRAASFGGFAAFDMVRGRTISAGAMNGTPGVNGSDGSASASEVSSRPPVMGSFGRTGDRRRAAIIDGSATVPSPFTARRRRSNSWKSGRKHFGTKSDIFPMLPRRARQNSIATTCSGRSSFHFTTEPDMDMDMESCTEPFELDDVLDFSNVSDEQPHHGSHVQEQGTGIQGEDHLRSLDRWDRVPMGTFRRTRETHGTGVVPGTSSSDGFSYGAASRGTWEGGVLWGGGLGTLGEGKALLSTVTSGHDSFGNAGESSTGGFEKAVSRKERRRRKKLAAASVAHVPTKSFITPPPPRKI
ncbi:hypothetical protein FRC06_008810 [Ceratobasidium sp. 370]|nr:hypothetical protein FRC06_008810 [Ceratobasidium sp. 370]